MSGPSLEPMLEELRVLVEAESFSSDADGLAACAEVIDGLVRAHLGSGLEGEGPTYVWRRAGDHPVLLLCHYDTVWPPGTLASFPFTVEDGVARGPGVFDMKAGIVMALHAVAATETPVTLLFTADEELGSPGSRADIEREAEGARATLVTEPASGDAIKVARKGVAHWRVEVKGRAAHAGLEPEKGVNAAVELGRQIEAIGRLGDPDLGTSVVVTRLGAGSAENVVPEDAWLEVDARMWTLEEADRLERAMAGLEASVPGALVTTTGGLNRGPLERAAAEALYDRLRRLGYEIEAAEVGGGSDGNFTAAMGIPTLDGLGAVGGGAHARDEHVQIGSLVERTRMLTALLADLGDD